MRTVREKRAAMCAAGLAVASVALLVVLSPAAANGAVVIPSLSPAPTSTCHATITQVSGLTERNLSRTIVIHGSCFGSHPTYVNVSSYAPYTGLVTQNCGTTRSPPTLSISEWGSSGTGDWSAGRFIATNGSCPWGDSIGLFYTTWTATLIVIHGFGSALGTATQNSGAPWQMTPHAECSVYLHNPANEKTPANYTMPTGTC
jgi:hypothetical protein